jgi:CRISPR/Cas system CSM-associated protein Csm3 (group 7 of RAMP superfamily)
MRDRDEYLRQGRNDPYSAEQMQEHPYDFVSLPEKPAQGMAVGHERYHAERWSGSLTLAYEILSPLHVGSGVFETAQDCGLTGGATPVRGITRRCGRPVLPGSGWKGAVRARFEAITRSRLGLADTKSREQEFKVPHALRAGKGPHFVQIKDRRVTDALKPLGTVKGERALVRLSPAEALFGCMGYRGRIHPNDGSIEGPAAKDPLQVAPLDGPVMHRLAAPGATFKGKGKQIEISQVEGRKFYYDTEVIHSRKIDVRGGTREVYELIDHVPAGGVVSIQVHVESVTLAELGALLIGAGYGAEVGIVRFGGYKPVGLGKVRLRSVNSQLWRGTTARTWRRPAPEEVDVPGVVKAAVGALVDQDALRELHQVTTRKRG